MRIKLYSHNNSLYTLSELSRVLGLPASTLHYKIKGHKKLEKNNTVCEIFIQWNEEHDNKIQLIPSSFDRYRDGWTLSEIANGQEIYILNPDTGYEG